MTASQPPDDHRAAAEVPRTSGHPRLSGSALAKTILLNIIMGLIIVALKVAISH
jgi:hypothetical protein